jgi:hypothetical protein
MTALRDQLDHLLKPGGCVIIRLQAVRARAWPLVAG